MGNGRRRWIMACAGATAIALAGAACGGDDDATPQSGERDTTTTAEAAVPAEPLAVLVTNDDGVAAEGIDVLVDALTGMDGVEVTVVAPSEQQSGTGGNTTDGPVHSNEATTAGGHEATSVDSFPSDAVRVAFDELSVEPDLLVSGINEGQNLGAIVDVSGTVGAARAAARRGVPALAVSQGIGEEPDFDVAADLAVDWITEHLDDLVAGEVATDVVFNLNVPTCEAGEVRGEVEVEVATSGDGAVDVADCTSTDEGQTDDIAAFNAGFATLSEVPLEPAA